MIVNDFLKMSTLGKMIKWGKIHFDVFEFLLRESYKARWMERYTKGEVFGEQSNVALWLNWQDNSVDQNFNRAIWSNSLSSLPYGLHLIMTPIIQYPTKGEFFHPMYHSLPLSPFLLLFDTFTWNSIPVTDSINAEIFITLK